MWSCGDELKENFTICNKILMYEKFDKFDESV